MPDFTYAGPDERYYPDTGLHVKPGDVVTLDAPLGDEWQAVAPAAQPAPPATPAAPPATSPPAASAPPPPPTETPKA